MPNIRTYCRIKPTEDVYPEHETKQDTILLRVPEVLRDISCANKTRTNIDHEFHFDYIFKSDTTQEEVFSVAAEQIVKGFLSGYNGTIFAYGQTGTGKTYTVEGSAKKYSQRGIEPRALSMIYEALEQRQDEDISIHISYLEIYKEIGYDLLNPGARTQSYVTPFPKVSVFEGGLGTWFVRNLSVHLAASEAVAQNLLLQGQANRRVAATTVHDRSSRSHAVFTIQLSSKKPGSDTVMRSKLHLVDLAGSERVSKTGVYGHQLTEAKSINLSLHHLETVIIALQSDTDNTTKHRIRTGYRNRSRSAHLPARPASADCIRSGNRHVPYRNSLLTMVLRDSLGGNCLTAMIATVSLEFVNLGETISTLRFAGRVACIANSVTRNVELDEKSLIKKLRKRVAELESELACIKLAQTMNVEGGDRSVVMKLTYEDRAACSKVVQQYLSGRINDPVSAGITDPYKFRECLKILKKMIVKGYFGGVPVDNNNNKHIVIPGDSFTELSKKEWEQADDNGMKLDGSAQILQVHTDGDTRHRKPQQAWGDGSVYRSNEQSSKQEKDSLHISNSRKDPETLSEMLNCSSADRYKSPYEQKREKQIKVLNKKVEKLQTVQQEKESELMEMRLSVAEQELSVLERSVKTKLDVAIAQVEDQKAYIRQLMTTEADSGVIEREKLVETQLTKRQLKLQKKLEYLEERRAHLKNHTQSKLESSKRPTVQEKFGQYKKRDGSLNTRQVFELLKTEEKKTTKSAAMVEREKMFVTSKHLEVKEAVTRQKLQEFKDMLNRSNTESNLSAFQDLSEERAQKMGGYSNGGEAVLNNTFTIESSFMESEQPDFSIRPESRQSVRSGKSTNSVLPDKDFYEKRKKEKDPTARWESSYSRPTTPFSRPTTPGVEVQPEKQIGVEWTPQIHDSGSVPNLPNGYLVNGMADEPLPNGHIEVDDAGTHSKNLSSQKKDVRTDVEREKGFLDIDVENGILERKSKQLEMELKNSFNKNKHDKISKTEGNMSKEVKEHRTPKRTYMPSEYIYGMSKGDKFDARKMNLGSRTFDSALASMLDRGSENVYASHEDYDQFARTNRTKYIYGMYKDTSSPPRKSKHENKSKENENESSENRTKERESRSREKRRTEVRSSDQEFRVSKGHESRGREREKKVRESDKQYPSENMWGPDAKNAPVSAKLAQFLQSSESHKKSRSGKLPYSSSEYGRSREDTLLEVSQNTTTLEIEEERPGKIKAFREQEREENFMSKAQMQRDRVARIRKARQAAETIQRAWRKYLKKR